MSFISPFRVEPEPTPFHSLLDGFGFTPALHTETQDHASDNTNADADRTAQILGRTDA